MASVNKVIAIGNLGNDPEVRSLPSGGKVVNFRIACNESWRDKNTGERKERVEWIPVVIFNPNLAEIAEKYLKKGSRVYVEGAFQTRKWQDQSGADRYSTEVVLQFNGQLVLLDAKEGGSSRPPPPDSPDSYGTQRARPSSGAPAPAYSSSEDDSIPF